MNRLKVTKDYKELSPTRPKSIPTRRHHNQSDSHRNTRDSREFKSVNRPFHIHMTDRATTPVESFYHRKKKQFQNFNPPKKCFIFEIYMENLFPCFSKFPYSSFSISNNFIYSKFMQLKLKLFYIQTPILSAGWLDMQEDLTMYRRNQLI